ncbi:solute carrier organic anion transporter family member 74D isoform X1 [Parasteatoda tepidariorum]|uniref:solute carrier organic anion transporter family member 74D isoform X1 n=1 Tax=Parasteatoda tepidariorum TaxID=114398 RepID=UPI00077FD5AA|nr:solute carrier organic anion transporter family member 74D isoform X1 [Parasteatoda tepidariorum]
MGDEKKGDGLYTISPEKFSQSTAALTELSSTKKNLQDDAEEDTKCGLGDWKPQWLQKLATPKLFLFFYSMAGLAQGAQFTYLVGCMSTLEKRYAYDSKKSGLVMISDEFPPILLGALIGYFGGLAHRPRLLAFGLLMGSLSCFIMAGPYFIYGPKSVDNVQTISKYTTVKAQFCDSDFNAVQESCGKSIATPVLSIFVLSNLVKGLASVIFYTIGTAYMDDSVKKNNSSVYLGTLFSLRLLGPTFGFLLSSLCLSFYEDPFYDPGYSTKDPRWIGAWWLGFIILGIAIFIFSIPMVLFPKRFPGKKLPSELKNKKETKPEPPKSPIEQLKDMGKAMKRLGKNPILICHYLGGVFRLNGLIGYYVLLPKYMETQFRQSASVASLYSGPAGLVGMIFGIFLGGIAIRKFKPRPRVMTGGIVFAECFSFLALIICMMITCPVYQMTGTSSVIQPQFSLNNTCNTDCLCSTKVYTPVCGPDGKSTYFSPCYAGCQGYNKTDGKEVFTDCKCVHDESGIIRVGEATKGYCNSECQWLITFVVVLCVGKLLSSTSRVANALVTLRCVDPKDKSIALGALSGVFSLLAFIPYPLIYGALTDASCLVWEKSCGKTGNCWIYDSDKFRYLLHGVSAGFVFLGCVTDVFVFILSPRLKNLYDDDEEEKKEPMTERDEVEIISNGGILGVFKTGVPNNSFNPLKDEEKTSTPL